MLQELLVVKKKEITSFGLVSPRLVMRSKRYAALILDHVICLYNSSLPNECVLDTDRGSTMTRANVSAPEAHTVKTSGSNKRSRQTFESILAIIDKNVSNEPQPFPKRPFDEAYLLAQYTAERAQPQQQQLQFVARSPNSFQYTPRKPPMTEPSLFSPASSKAFASPVSNSLGSRGTPIRQGTQLPAQQSTRTSRSPMLSSASASLHSRYCHVALMIFMHVYCLHSCSGFYLILFVGNHIVCNAMLPVSFCQLLPFAVARLWLFLLIISDL